MPTNIFRQFLLDTIERLDAYEAAWAPDMAIALGSAAGNAAARAGHLAAIHGHPELYRRSLDFGALADWPAVKGYLAECLAATVPDAPPPVADTLTAADVARLLGVDVRTVWRRRNDETLPPPIKLGRLVRWPRAEFEKWLASN